MAGLVLGTFTSESEEAFSVVARPRTFVHPYVKTGGGFMVVSKESLRLFRDAGLSGHARLVLDYLMHVSMADNVVVVTRESVASFLGISRPEVSRVYGVLRECGFLYQLEGDSRHLYRVSPRIMWKGNPRDLPAAIAAYDRVRSGARSGVVSLPRERFIQEISA